MEENKTNDLVDEDLQEVVIEEPAVQEGDKKRLKKRIFNLIYDVLILIGIGCLIYGGYSLYEGYRDSKEAEQSHEDLKNDFVSVPVIPNIPDGTSGSEGTDGTEPSSETQIPERPREWYEQIRVDLEGMQTQINPDIIGWIHFENESISYPLLYSEDNAEYQRVRYDLVYSRGGSIFLEASNSWDLSDIRNVIYGHNMKDESMFGKLKYYNDKKSYYDDHQYFQLLYDGMVYRYQIFSYFTIHQNEVSYVNTNFTKGSEKYGEFLEKLVENSKKDTGVEVDADDKTVTLVTCSKDNTYRFIVSAVLVDQHTMANADGTFPDEPGTEPDDTEPDDTEPETEPDDTEPDDTEPGTEPGDTENPDPGVRPGADNYTYTEVGKTMMATVSVKIRNKPSTEGVRIALLGKHDEVFVEAVCNETGWYRVRYGTGGRRIGYINGNYLTEEDLHVYVPMETTAPTCTTEGVMSHRCECGVISHTEPIAPRHTETFEGAGTADIHSMCTVCGQVASTEHSYTDTVETAPGCTTPGVMVHTCACGYSHKTEIPPTHTEVYGGEEHVHTKCGECGEILSTEHVYTDTVTKEATTTEEGILTHTCECGHSYTETIPKMEEETESTTESESESESESLTPTESEAETETETEAEIATSSEEDTSSTEQTETEVSSESAE